MARFKIFLGEFEQHTVTATSPESAIATWLDTQGYDTAEEALAEYFGPGDDGDIMAVQVSG